MTSVYHYLHWPNNTSTTTTTLNEWSSLSWNLEEPNLHNGYPEPNFEKKFLTSEQPHSSRYVS